MAVDALGLVSVNETVIVPKTKVSMYDLEVPLQYKLLHYNPHPFTSAVIRAVPTGLARKLKCGGGVGEAESKRTQSTACDDSEVIAAEHESDAVLNDRPQIPARLLELQSYHPMHIFNPMPGVRAHPEQLPYSEISDDFTLTPLSRAMTKPLDRDGVIPGVMNWKKFPVHGLTAMSGTPSLYHVYVPRWSDPFSEELVPTHTPQLLTCLDPDDVVNEETATDASEDSGFVPSMGMVNAEFAMIEDLEANVGGGGGGRGGGSGGEDVVDTPLLSVSLTLPPTNNPQSAMGMMSRVEMQSELNTYLNTQMNKLGESVRERFEIMKEKWDLDDISTTVKL